MKPHYTRKLRLQILDWSFRRGFKKLFGKLPQRVKAQLIRSTLVDVQPMTGPTKEVFYMDFKTTSKP